ncbi:MAG TPA: NADH-quinone oxidoreductase subunit L, partial [Acidobacteriota bacterium]
QQPSDGGQKGADTRHPAPDTHHLKAGEHPHESPWVMVGPLVALAFFSIFAGYVGVPGWFKLGGQWLEHFLEPVFEHQYTPAAAQAANAGLEIWLTVLSVLVSAAGMATAYILYIRRPQLPAHLATRFRALYILLYNKYYVDEAYDTLVVHPIQRTSESFLWKAVDVSTIDGSVNGIATLFQNTGDVLKRMQSGYARAYGSWILFGALLVLLYLFLQ